MSFICIYISRYRGSSALQMRMSGLLSFLSLAYFESSAIEAVCIAKPANRAALIAIDCLNVMGSSSFISNGRIAR